LKSWEPPRFSRGRRAGRKFAYKLKFKLFKTTFNDDPHPSEIETGTVTIPTDSINEQQKING
jgi:polyisoprenoid-binding protein YceI